MGPSTEGCIIKSSTDITAHAMQHIKPWTHMLESMSILVLLRRYCYLLPIKPKTQNSHRTECNSNWATNSTTPAPQARLSVSIRHGFWHRIRATITSQRLLSDAACVRTWNSQLLYSFQLIQVLHSLKYANSTYQGQQKNCKLYAYLYLKYQRNSTAIKASLNCFKDNVFKV